MFYGLDNTIAYGVNCAYGTACGAKTRREGSRRDTENNKYIFFPSPLRASVSQNAPCLSAAGNRRGSALLIVLGFLSFMVVSAVAFSVFMRTERAPSSVFRRGVTTRHLLHAALARAISKVDDAIRDDPFPGVYSADPHKAHGGRHYDKWLGRVFMPIEPQYNGVWDYKNKNRSSKDGDYPSSDDERIVPEGRIGETVPVLNLEALGYLPPALINDVRYLARLSWSSKWDYFNFNAGRYAYVAVNVSDYFDVNKTPVNEPRSMASPVTLDYLFQSGDKMPASVKKTASIDSSALSQVADFLLNRGSGGADFPFVSMLDYTLAAGKHNVAALPSPFYKYADGKSTTMYSGASAGANDDMARQMFVAGSAVAVTGAADRVTLTEIRSSTKCGQPFRDLTDDEMEGGLTVDELLTKTLPNGRNGEPGFRDSLCMADRIDLYDYLDRDDIPTSLATPTTERVPMVTGIDPTALQFNLHVEPGVEPAEPQVKDNPLEGFKEIPYSLAPDTIGPVQVLKATLAFPFKRGKALRQSFKIQAAARFFLMHKDLSGGEGLRKQNAMRPQFALTDTSFRPGKSDWKGSASASISDSSIFMLSAVQDLAKFPSGEIEEEGDAVFTADLQFSTQPAVGDYATHPVYVLKKYYTREEQVDANGNRSYTEWVEDASRRSFVFGGPGRFKPYGAGWNVEYTAEREVKVADAGQLPTDEFVPSVAVWVRVLDSRGQYTLDLVPANVADDELNDVNNTQISMIMQDMCGSGIPLLRFTGGGAAPAMTFDASKAADLANPLPVAWYPQGMYAVDPRYNFAPEDWVESTLGVNENDWLSKAAIADGADGRQGDIFFFVSNQGYMQSMAELAFLPKLGNLENNSLKPFGATGGGYNGAMRTDRNETANFRLLWKTYHAFAENGDGSDDLFDLGIEDGNDTAFRVNPYTTDPNIRLAAFANTPYDWWVAGTNATTSSSVGQNSKDPSEKTRMENSAAARLDYSFNEKSSESRMKYDEVAGIANYVYSHFAAEDNRSGDWKTVFDGLPWSSGQVDELFGIQLERPLHDVDRKFLYGFWRNCFANQQQLFLIFVRAESTALGGAGDGGTPAQLGGRAVALVWRDPNPPLGDHDLDRIQTRSDSGYERRPHRTRVLFYHQFE